MIPRSSDRFRHNLLGHYQSLPVHLWKTFHQIVIQPAFVFCHPTAVPKSQMSVFPPNPRLAKLGIEPIEPIDDVDCRTVGESGEKGIYNPFCGKRSGLLCPHAGMVR